MGGRTRKLRNQARREGAPAPVVETKKKVTKKKSKKKTT